MSAWLLSVTTTIQCVSAVSLTQENIQLYINDSTHNHILIPLWYFTEYRNIDDLSQFAHKIINFENI